jgi:lipopolysaccharide transport system ATP-binding protein
VVAVGESIKLHLVAVPTKRIPDLTIGYSIKDKLGQIIFATNTQHLKHDLKDLEPNKKIDLKFSFLANLGEGTYSISCSLHEGKTHLAKNYEWKDLALVFTVVNSRNDFFLGTSWMPPNLTQIT